MPLLSSLLCARPEQRITEPSRTYLSLSRCKVRLKPV